MNDLKYLCFMSVCETNSFSNTAAELMITQQAVSRYIQKLESELGFRFLIREQNLVTPTVAGQQLLRFLKESNQRFQEISLKTRKSEFIIRIGISDWIGNTEWIAGDSENFFNKYPGWQLVFCETDDRKALEMINHQLIDCYLTTNYSLEHIRIPCTANYLFSSELCLVHAPDFDYKKIHLTTAAGEMDETCIKARDIRIYQELCLPVCQFEIYPNHSSVLWTASLGNGQCFVPKCSSITENPFFHTEPLNREIDIVLGVFSSIDPHIISQFTTILREAAI
ncbi:MAG: LysR family transcriptional regulator [Eubacterium sp.]|nr:LysR family transcriptional regulator [Eubacterium sp.]